MNYKHLTIEERCCLREYYKKGYSYRKIAELMGRNVSTISRELNRNFTHMYDIATYYPHTAQKKYLLRRSYCHRGMYQDPRKLEYIKEKLQQTWSPEQIASTPCELEMPSTRTIYRWIYEKYIDVNLKVLRRKGKSRGKKETRGKFNLGKSIRKRDKSVYKRLEFGHWEADTVVSGRGKSKACYISPTEDEDKMTRLRRLDASVTKSAQTVALVFGIIGALILGFGMSLCMTEIGEVLGSYKDMAMVIGIIIGIIGGTLASLAYPVYNAIVNAKRKKLAPEIIRLADELMK